EVTLRGQGEQLLGLGARLRLRLLDEDVLPGRERLLRERVVRDDRGRNDHRVDLRVCEQILEVARRPGLRVSLGSGAEQVGREVAEPAHLREGTEVSREVRAPVAE